MNTGQCIWKLESIYAQWRTDMDSADEHELPTKKCQVQLVLKNEKKDGGTDVKGQRRMLSDMGNYPKFLFSSEQRWRLGYDPKEKFGAIDWDYDRIDMEAPEYTPSTHSITFNFIMKTDTYPREIVDILQANGWTVTGRHRMGVGIGNGKTEWEAWNTKLEEALWRTA